MGLRCLFGHDFSEPEIEREREEDGEEVVTTVREVKTCARCGETQIVSENTEVTTMEQLTEQAARGAATPTEPTDRTEAIGPTGSMDGPGGTDTPPNPSPDAGSTDRTPDIDYGDAATGVVGPDEDDAEILDETPQPPDVEPEAEAPEDAERVDDAANTDDRAVATDDEGAGLIDDEGAGLIDDEPTDDLAADHATESADAAEESADAADDDGVILDDQGSTDDAGDRGRGEWPTVEGDEDEPTFEGTPWPEQEGEDEGFDAEVGGDGDSGVEFGGLTPEVAEPAAESADAEYVGSTDRSSPSGSDGVDIGSGSGDADPPADESIGSGITREEGSKFETPDARTTPTEYYCPECEMTVESEGSSLRTGDICPECKRGYVAERPR